MKNISKFEKEKLLQLLECNEVELEKLVNNSKKIIDKDYNYYDILLKILQQGCNIREATLTGILLGEKIGFRKAEIEMEEQIKDKLYRAFKNTQ